MTYFWVGLAPPNQTIYSAPLQIKLFIQLSQALPSESNAREYRFVFFVASWFDSTHSQGQLSFCGQFVGFHTQSQPIKPVWPAVYPTTMPQHYFTHWEV